MAKDVRECPVFFCCLLVRPEDCLPYVSGRRRRSRLQHPGRRPQSLQSLDGDVDVGLPEAEGEAKMPGKQRINAQVGEAGDVLSVLAE